MPDKIKIKMIVVGSIPFVLNRNRISNWSSELFEISGNIDTHKLRTNSDGAKWRYLDQNIRDILPVADGAVDFQVAIVSVPLEDNFYERRLEGNWIIVSTYEIRKYLAEANIPIENVILRVLYACALVFMFYGKQIPLTGAEDPKLTHDETKGCLFDMNGDKSEVVFSCDHPILCQECQGTLGQKISRETIEKCQKEIRKIRKTPYYRITDYIKGHPIRSLAATVVGSVLIGAMSSFFGRYLYSLVFGACC